ncbi:anti-sigma factor [Billgrantia antri]|uniref:anti-sigma factor n=1 Tax=Billgrantia antri TaxID=2846777 RepID=UPI003B22013E
MTGRNDLDMLAAEFVLGTLEADERDWVARRRQQEPELDALIADWEARLAPLGEEVQPLAPGPELLARIERRIAEVEANPPGSSHQQEHATAQIATLRRRLRRWQWSTGLASAAALVLAVVLSIPFGQAPEEPPFVAVFQQDDQQPAFLLTVDLDSRQLHVQPVTAEPLPARSYQLWIKDDSLGPAPRSVGVLEDDLTLDAAALRDYPPELLKRATFGISIEPAGGSPTGQPTGPAIHGYLYPTAQEATPSAHQTTIRSWWTWSGRDLLGLWVRPCPPRCSATRSSAERTRRPRRLQHAGGKTPTLIAVDAAALNRDSMPRESKSSSLSVQ